MAITVFVVSIVLMYAVKATGTLRVSPAGETEGLDLHEHGTGAYPEFVVTRGMGIMSSMASSPVPAARPATESGKYPSPSPASRHSESRREAGPYRRQRAGKEYSLKKVEAVIRPDKVPVVRKALQDIGLPGVTLTQVAGHGQQGGITQQWKGNTYTVDILTKVKLEIVVSDELVEKAVSVIAEKGRTGKIGDGKIFVSSLEQAIRIRTGEKDTDAL